MKIVALDFSEGYEQISLAPSRYGGVGRSLAALQSSIPNFEVLSLSRGQLDFDAIRLPEDTDIVLHTEVDKDIQVKYKDKTIPTCVWAPGQGVSCASKNILIHSPYQNISARSDAKFYDVVLGIPIPEFEYRSRRNSLFQCSNHYPQIQSIELAAICNHNGILCTFAGPISEGYNLKQHIRWPTTIYLGEITEEEKINRLKSEGATVGLYNFPINSDSLAHKLALSWGMPVITTQLGNPHGTIVDGHNGFIVDGYDSFVSAYKRMGDIDQRACWESVQKYSLEKMAASFIKVFGAILNG